MELVDWTSRTLVDVLRERAVATPEEVVYTFLQDGEREARTLTYGELDRRARAIARTLQRLTRPGDRVLLFYPDGLDYVTGVFGCLFAGLVGVSGAAPLGPRSLPRLFSILNDASPAVIAGTQALLAEYQTLLRGDLGALRVKWLPTDTVRGRADDWTDPAVSNDSVALLQYTSGSTGTPRGVMLTHRNLLHNLQAQVRAFEYRCGDVGVSWLPFSHDMGLIGALLMAVFAGGPCVLFSSMRFVEKPVRWLRAISTYRATLSGAPNFAYDLCVRRISAADRRGLDLSSWKIAFNGAETVRPETVARFTETFRDCGFRPEAMYPCYGLAEATLAVTGGTPSAIPAAITVSADALGRAEVAVLDPHASALDRSDKAVRLLACGRAMSDHEVLIVCSADRSVCQPRHMGEIWVGGPSVAQGYFNREGETCEWFRATLSSGAGPYLRTGDLGFIHDGELFVTGRVKDLIIIRGTNYYPQDLEFTAEASHGALRPGCSAAFSIEHEDEEALVVACEIENGREAEADEAIAAIRRAITEQHELRTHGVVLLRAATLPKTPNGKLQRQDCRRAYLAGQLVIVRESRLQPLGWQEALEDQWRRRSGQRPEEFEEVKRWFLDRLEASGLDVTRCRPDMALTELGIDSLAIVELKAELDAAFGIRIQAADLINFADVSSLVDHVLDQVVRARADGREETAPAPAPASAVASADVENAVQGKNRLQRQRALRVRGSAAGPHGGVAAAAE
jgi:acyl-CoA synthetase (AMP-forming)/AMP-acid ligase II/acyl carrier protein